MPSHAKPLVSVGQSRHADALTAARMAARQARAQLGADQAPGWLLAFAGGLHDPQAVLEGFRAELGPLPIVGGSGAGILATAGAQTSGYECGVLSFAEPLAPSAIVRVQGLDQDELSAGRRLGEQLRALDLAADRVVLLFYDSVKSAPPPVLHIGSRLLDGVHQGLRPNLGPNPGPNPETIPGPNPEPNPEKAADRHAGAHPPLIVGAGVLSGFDMLESYLFDGQGASRHSAVAVVLPAALLGHTTIMHGCLPASDFLEITDIQGDRVRGLQGQPALRVVEERLGVSREELLARQPLPFLTLGEKHGDPYAPFNDDQYVNRLVVAVDPQDESLVLFEADFQVGSRIQIMSYEPARMIESARVQTESILASLAGQAIAFGLYFDCAGRAMPFSGAEEDESKPVRERVGAISPFLGVYTGIEIAPFLGRARPLDWTGVLLLCTQRD